MNAESEKQLIAAQDAAEQTTWDELIAGAAAKFPDTWTERQRRATVRVLMSKDLREVFGQGFSAGIIFGLDIAKAIEDAGK